MNLKDILKINPQELKEIAYNLGLATFLSTGLLISASITPNILLDEINYSPFKIKKEEHLDYRYLTPPVIENSPSIWIRDFSPDKREIYMRNIAPGMELEEGSIHGNLR